MIYSSLVIDLRPLSREPHTNDLLAFTIIGFQKMHLTNFYTKFFDMVV